MIVYFATKNTNAKKENFLEIPHRIGVANVTQLALSYLESERAPFVNFNYLDVSVTFGKSDSRFILMDMISKAIKPLAPRPNHSSIYGFTTNKHIFLLDSATSEGDVYKAIAPTKEKEKKGIYSLLLQVSSGDIKSLCKSRFGEDVQEMDAMEIEEVSQIFLCRQKEKVAC